MHFKRRRRAVKVFCDQMERIQEFARRENGAEIGGLLLGHWEDSNVIIEQIVEVVDPNATYSSWSRDQHRAQDALDKVLATDRRSPTIGYVGDWHTHPEMICASSTDFLSLKKDSKSYDEPLVMVVRLSDGSFDVHAALRGKLLEADLIS